MTLEQKQEAIKDAVEHLSRWFEITSPYNDGPCLEDVVEEVLTDYERRLSKTE